MDTKKIHFVLAIFLFGMASFYCRTEGNETNETGLALLALVDAQTKAAAAAEAAARNCETNLETYASGTYASLCSPSAGAGRFFRVEGLKTTGDNGYLYLFLGYTSQPSSVTPNSVGQYQFVVGKSVSNANPFAWFRNVEYGNYQAGQTASGANPSISFSSEKELCVNFSGTTAAPKVNLWITDVNGANCQNTSTLTETNAIINYIGWSNTSNTISTSSSTNFFRFSSTSLLSAKKIAISSQSIF
ncbi:hypothetical protein LPTSP4_25600 [Leptospira ryugenii]|uniref:Uncharacterized protein n=1 Tax=Leptospira ryugenii TaxID=1917863 RepID=A0A2P2E2E3_9LEPT|nr:hypothetical protein [Leptospira ryugenii]GBF51029.1 hypothetical protein LPTSP4_25600 [Leptospira ryugenii]